MQRLINCLYVSITLIAVLADINCCAQGFQNKFQPRVVYERDVERAPQDVTPMFKDTFDVRKHRAGTLNRLGTELLLNDPANSRIIVVDTKTFAETNVPTPSPAIDVQIDPQTDMLFVDTYPPNRETDAIHTCYENLDELKKRKAMWSREGRPLGLHHFQQIRWLKGCQRFIAFSPNAHGTKNLILLDENGIKIAKHEIKGCVIGVDETEQGFNIFYLAKSGNTQQLTLTQLDGMFNELETKKLPLVDRVQMPPGGPGLGITQGFRLRGLKAGDVTKYFLTMAGQPGYLDTTSRFPQLKYTSRFFYANKMSAAESPLQPEIITGSHSSDGLKGFVLFDQQSNYYEVPDQVLTDAFFDVERRMIVTVADTKKRSQWKVRLISFE